MHDHVELRVLAAGHSVLYSFFTAHVVWVGASRSSASAPRVESERTGSVSFGQNLVEHDQYEYLWRTEVPLPYAL
jgi:hypothetical protein